MTGPRKFTFDQRFDVPGSGGGNSAAPGAAPRAKRFYSPEDMEAAKTEAYERGRGSIEARTAQTQSMALSQIAEAMLNALKTLDQMAAEARADALQAAIHAAKRIADVALRRFPLDEIEETIAHCLAQAPHEPRIAVRVASDVADALKARIGTLADDLGFAGRIVVTADTRIAAADCRLEWTDGGVERDSHAIAARIDEVIARFIEADRRRAEEAIGA